MEGVVLGWGGRRDHTNSGSRTKAVALDVTLVLWHTWGCFFPCGMAWQPQALGPVLCHLSIAQVCFPGVASSVLWGISFVNTCVCICIQHMHDVCVCVCVHHAGVLYVCIWHEELSYRVSQFRDFNSRSVICWFYALGTIIEPLGAWGFWLQGDGGCTSLLGLLWAWNEFVHKRV